MKVLMFGWEFPPHISGGLGTACHGLTKEMVNLGIGITFVLPKLKGDYSSTGINVVGPTSVAGEIIKEEETIEIDSLLKKYKVDSALHPYMNKETYAEYLQELERKRKRQSFEMAEADSIVELSGDYGVDLMTEVSRYATIGKFLARKEEFDVIHAHDWMTYQAGVEAKKESGKPLIVHVHATEFDRTGNNVNTEIYCIEKYGMDMADHIIAVSQRTKDIIIDKYSQDPRKITVVYNAVEKDDIMDIEKMMDESAFGDDKIVLFLGRITTQKGPEYFINAANIVLNKKENVRFVMAGSGDMSRKMIEQMASLKLSDRFHFTGFLRAPERERLFAMSDLYVMPSVSEPFGITPLEAMKHNIPVIISKQSGIAEILPHAVKIDFWDVQKLADSILELLENPQASDEMLMHHQDDLRNINWIDSAQDVLDVYRRLS